MPLPYPVIDLFAGPGGLSEGFAASEGFRVALSIEKDPVAHQTLELRAFFRQFDRPDVPDEYYQHLRDPKALTRSDLFDAFPKQANAARQEAWQAELGVTPHGDVEGRIRAALIRTKSWVLIGGPPCQAYSLVGRSRRGGMDAKDKRVHLYREYLRILADHAPPVFVMENVKGLLSAKLDGQSVFAKMHADLAEPARAINSDCNDGPLYRIVSLVSRETNLFDDSPANHGQYVIACEKYGIPQARHRVILLGIRSDVDVTRAELLQRSEPVPVRDVLDGLPRLRSGLSKGEDSAEAWQQLVRSATDSEWYRELVSRNGSILSELLKTRTQQVNRPRYDRGSEFLPKPPRCRYLPEWFLDERIDGVCNHSTRSHIDSDIHRYLFAATFAEENGVSPTLADFPRSLLPAHDNAEQGVKNSHFADRFRVQVRDRPSTTVTSHISKDGHYYIHYDSRQCRSLTVREAARLQTFPDNYFFCGPRTEQYQQVGNAVPPLLAKQIAEIVARILDGG